MRKRTSRASQDGRLSGGVGQNPGAHVVGIWWRLWPGSDLRSASSTKQGVDSHHPEASQGSACPGRSRMAVGEGLL